MSGLERLALAARIALRELRGGMSGLGVFVGCLAIGVAAIAAIAVVNASITDTLQRDGRILLGGDVMVENPNQRLDSDRVSAIRPQGADLSETMWTSSVVEGASGRHVAVSLRAVDDHYPLAGEILLDPPIGIDAALEGNGAVVERGLLARLGVELGEEVTLGTTSVRLNAVIVREPDPLGGSFNIGPRLMTGIDSAIEAGIAGQGSLTRWRYTMALPPSLSAPAYARDLAQGFPEEPWQIRGSHQVQPRVERVTGQLSTYLTLAGLAGLLIGGLGVGLAIKAYLESKTRTVATLKCLGAETGLITTTYLLQVLVLASLGIAAGLVVGQALPLVVNILPPSVLPFDVEVGLQPWPLVFAAACGYLTALVFAIWPLAMTREISPAMLFRSIVQPVRRWPRGSFMLVLATSLAGLALLATFGVSEPLVGAGFVAVAAASGIILTALARLVLRGCKQLAGHVPFAYRLGARNIARAEGNSASVIIALGAGIAVLTTIALLEASIGREVEQQFAERAPSTIFIDIQQDQVEPFKEAVAQTEGAELLQFLPMLRARIVRINGVPAAEAEIADNVRWTLNRDRGLTWSAAKPQGTELVTGEWWPEDYRGETLVSIEDEIAIGYGIGVGDTLSFNVLGRVIEARIASLRPEIDWSDGQLQFLFILSPGLIDQAPHMSIAAVEADGDAQSALLSRMAADLPNVTPISVGEVIDRIAAIMENIGIAMKTVAGVTLVTGILVLAGAVNAARRQQRYQSLIFKILGAKRQDMVRMFAIEYLVLGLAAAAMGITIGTLGAWLTTFLVFDLPLALAPLAMIGILVGTLAMILLVGTLSIRRLLGQSAATMLRAA